MRSTIAAARALVSSLQNLQAAYVSRRNLQEARHTLSKDVSEYKGKMTALQEKHDLLMATHNFVLDDRDKAKAMTKLEADNGLIIQKNLELEDQGRKLQEEHAATNLATDWACKRFGYRYFKNCVN